MSRSDPRRRAKKKTSNKALAALRRRYAEDHLPQIQRIAARLARRLPAHVDVDDLISAGVIGLMDAVGRFDIKREVAFEAFAEPRIRGAMLDWLRASDSLSRDMRRLSNELRDASRRLETALGRTPDQEEVARSLGLELDELYAKQQQLAGSSVVGLDDVSPNFLDRHQDHSATDPSEVAERRQEVARVVASIDDLPERMQQILSLYYCEDMNLQEIARVLGVTESRVCQIHTDATRRLRAALVAPYR